MRVIDCGALDEGPQRRHPRVAGLQVKRVFESRARKTKTASGGTRDERTRVLFAVCSSFSFRARMYNSKSSNVNSIYCMCITEV